MSAPWSATGTLVADDKTLEYACCGPQPYDAPTLVLLHEGLGCLELWRKVPEALAEATGFGVFAFSRAGYGRSDPVALPRPLDYMTREAIDVLPGVLDAIGVQRAILLGHSDGGTIAAIHAGCVVDPRIIGIVLMAPHFFTEAVGLAEIAKAREAFDSGDLRARLGKYHSDPDNAFRGWNEAWLDPDFTVGHAPRVLDAIRVPVLAIQGRDDPYGTLAQIEAIVDRVSRAPVTTLILDGCGHAPHLEQGSAVIAAVAAFCKRLAPSASTEPVQPTVPLPPYAYVPGQNMRHADGAFDALRQSARSGLDAAELARTPAFRAGLRFLETGYFWEAHEVLESVWMALPDGGVERRFVQGLIQLANGRLKLRMGRPKAVRRLIALARALLPNVDTAAIVMSVDTNEVHRWIDALEREVSQAS